MKPQVPQRRDLPALYRPPRFRCPTKLQVLSRQQRSTLREGLAHEQVFLAQLRVGFESFPLKHSNCSKPEGPRSSFFGSGRVRLDYSSALLLNRVQRRLQGNSCYALFPEVSVYEEPSETSEFSALIF